MIAYLPPSLRGLMIAAFAAVWWETARRFSDDEIALMLKRIKRGFEFSEENFALDDIQGTGPGGMFIDKPRTISPYFSTSAFSMFCLIR